MLLAARFIYGIATGLTIVAVSLYFSETIPAERTGRYGFTINFGIVTGITIMLALGLFKPDSDSDDSTVHFALYLFNIIPIAISTIVLILWFIVFRQESTDYCLKHENQNENRSELFKMINSVYHIKEMNGADEIVEKKR